MTSRKSSTGEAVRCVFDTENDLAAAIRVVLHESRYAEMKGTRSVPVYQGRKNRTSKLTRADGSESIP